MIEDPPLLDIAQEIKRAPAHLVDQFRGVPTSFIVDAMNGRGALHARIKPVTDVGGFTGSALPCLCRPADNLALCAAVAICEAGDVLIAATDSFEECSVVGDLLLGIARNRGATAFVTDGMVRDIKDIEALDFPCFAAGVTPNSPSRNGPGTVGLPIQCGGIRISSGDIVVGDRDGVVIIPRHACDVVLKQLESVKAAEAHMLAQVKNGLTEVGFVKGLMASNRVRRIEN